MYSGLKYLIYPTDDDPKVDNSRMSGGFPHSDIHGSKPIPGSPWLNAGYHVLHRLLLPRHPPNALFALDLIQKEQGQGLTLDRLSGCGPLEGPRIKSSTYPHHRLVRTVILVG
jgi:hypothetical protein